ncbi:MAG TPA: GNAT family N-acetyltransferase [Flavisolibacter sp.]|nr:GNAT family N-acetyltransferase [Flavisolibacter sp.]
MAQINDFDFVYDIYMDEEANPYLTFDPMEREAFKQLYNSLLQTNTLYIAEDGADRVGTYRLIPKENRQAHCLYLGSFGVKPSIKGKGYGYQILETIKQDSREQGYLRLELTVDVKNDRAIKAYEKAGFEIEGRIRKSYKLAATGEYYDEYLMAVLL